MKIELKIPDSPSRSRRIISGAFFWLLLAGLLTSCTSERAQTVSNSRTPEPSPVADSFAYPVGPDQKLTQAKDTRDEWFNALDFRKNGHLGEDWNKNSGGNTDCGEPVYAVANGKITYAADAGPGWGNVVIIEHTLKSGERVQTLYAHMQKILKTSGEVKRREQIGNIGNANGRYLCHLHLELRERSSRDWNKVGGGYSSDAAGWLDPSDLIDKQWQKHDR
ncbi:MAG: M23 family metallopeptidase [Pyrinomonadaceae bacterium]